MLHLFTCHGRIMPRLAELLFMNWNNIHAYHFQQHTNSFCPEQDMPISVQNGSCSTSLAASNMVLRGSTTTCLSSSSSSFLSKLLTQSRKVSTSKSPSTQQSRLRVIKQSVRDKNLANVAVFVSKSRQISTQKPYDAKWILYTIRYHRRKVN